MSILKIKLVLDIIVYVYSVWSVIIYIHSLIKKKYKIWIDNKKIYTFKKHIHIIEFSITNSTDRIVEFIDCELHFKKQLLTPEIPYFNKNFPGWETNKDKNCWEFLFINAKKKDLIKDVFSIKPKHLSPDEKLYIKMVFDFRKSRINISKLKLTIKTSLGNKEIFLSSFHREFL